MSVSNETIRSVAERLRAATETGVPIAPFRDELAAGGVAAAYAVQEANTAFYLAQGKKLVGRKIGATSKAVQTQLGVDSPDFGMLFADMALADGEEVALKRLLQPKAEAEVAFVLEKDLLSVDITMADMISAVAYALPAIEIVGSRIAKWNIKLLDTVADNASSGLFVLGNDPRKLDSVDLRMCGMVIEKRGRPISVGLGAACLGHPLNAALWLAKTMVEVGRPLKAGDIIMSGALGPLAPIDAGDRIDVRINGLGSVRAVFAS